MPQSGTLQVAIVGSGPSGFYAAEALLRAKPGAAVDMFDRLPTPFGLVRGGVAPDHPKIKQVILVYDKIARSPGFSFIGNVTVGRDIAVADLQAAYHVVIFANGADADRRLGIQGEDLRGSHTATEFVGWYNGHPDYRDRVFDLSGETAAVIGQGNVAADVARILATPVDDLRRTDIAEHALEVLAESRVREIHIIGRRGPAQAKFTSVELKELGKIRGCAVSIAAGDLELNGACQAELADPRGDENRKNVDVLRGFAGIPAGAGGRRLCFRFLATPLRFSGPGRVETITLARNRLQGEPFRQVAIAASETVELPCQLVFRSIGYKGTPLPGIVFHEGTGTVPNRKGRVLDREAPVPGLYVTGWIKRGPTGIIGTNRADSVETVAAIVEDLAGLDLSPRPGSAGLLPALQARGLRPVSYAGWQAIDLVERARGEPKGKPREKFTRIPDMLQTIDGGRSTGPSALE